MITKEFGAVRRGRPGALAGSIRKVTKTTKTMIILGA